MPKAPRTRTDAPSLIPSFDYGGNGQPLHFLHANGYPPECYRPLLERLATEYHVFGMLLRPLWPKTDPADISDWTPFSDDLRDFLRKRCEPDVIGMGHSVGAIVTLRTALREPRLFRALILIDPVLLPRRRILQLQVMRVLGLSKRLNRRIAGALGRRRHFDDLEQLFEGYRRRDIFRFFSDEHLHALVRGITRSDNNGGYELAYSPEWEARIYETGIWKDWDIWSGLRALRIPTLIIRGRETDTFWESTAQMVSAANPGIDIQSVPASTHLVPMEQPEAVFDITRAFLEHSGSGHAN